MEQIDIELDEVPQTMFVYPGYEDIQLNIQSNSPSTEFTLDATTYPNITYFINQSTTVNSSTVSTLNFLNTPGTITERSAPDTSESHTYNYHLQGTSYLKFQGDAGIENWHANETTNVYFLGAFSDEPGGPGVTFIISGDTDVSNLENIPQFHYFGPDSKVRVNNADYTGTFTGEYDQLSSEIRFYNQDGINIARFKSLNDLSKYNLRFSNGELYIACFLKGTHIGTPEGEVRVETLKAGDKVLTANGAVATVKWLGHRTLYNSRILAKDAVRAFPIVFRKDSIADNVPHRDLTLSPGHHVSFNGTLVPAIMLVNGQTIVQLFDSEVFEYFHVELEQFDIIVAEGVPAESYVDTGNRSMFQNAGEIAMNPDFGPAKDRPTVAGIELLQKGPKVEAIRKQLLDRAEQMTGASRTDDPQLCIEVNGHLIYPVEVYSNEIYRFDLPDMGGDVHIVSRSAIVRETTNKPTRDLRNVGVGLAGICLEYENNRESINLQDPSLLGLHDVQDVNGTLMRWTNGNAVIPAALINTSGVATLELAVLRTYYYWTNEAPQKVIRAA